MKRLAILVLLLAGCDAETRPYRVVMVRPNGGTHRVHVGTSWGRPAVHNSNGCQWVMLNERIIDAPSGWLLEAEEMHEREVAP